MQKKNGPPVGKPINIEIRGNDYKVLRKIAGEYISYIKTIKGVYDLSIDFEEGKLEYRYTINEKMSTLAGVSTVPIAIALNASFKGAVATSLRDGEDENTKESMGELGVYFLFAIVVIFIILAVYFDSMMLPVAVMSAIPFSLVGVVFALFVHGEILSFMSVLGLFALAGIIVSNTLVLVQFINNLRDEGLSLKESLIQGGVIRLRPVLLTSGTTVLGLFPTIYALGGKDYFVAPLALSFGYGLIFAHL